MRRLWLNLHLCIGLGLAALLVPISLTGAVLVWHEPLEALFNPDRYAVTGGTAQTPAALVKSAQAALPGFAPVSVRLPDDAHSPAVVTVRQQRSGEGGRARQVMAYLDPPTGKLLATAEFRDSVFGWMHRFHENLTVPEWNGRSVVGWSGVALLVMSLSGIYLWWPREGFLRGLRYRRGPATSSNLHHIAGFWISIPLAVVSATGIYLGFPQQGRELIATVAPMTPSQRGGFNAPLLASPRIDADRVAAVAVDGAAGVESFAIFLPMQSNNMWRVQLRGPDGESTVLIDDRNGSRNVVKPLPGDRAVQWLRWIHEGSHLGLVWRIVVFICGILPTLFAVTGTMIWLRSRKGQMTGKLAGQPQMEAAE